MQQCICGAIRSVAIDAEKLLVDAPEVVDKKLSFFFEHEKRIDVAKPRVFSSHSAILRARLGSARAVVNYAGVSVVATFLSSAFFFGGTNPCGYSPQC